MFSRGLLVVLLICLFCLWQVAQSRATVRDYLTGCWEGEAGFLEEAGLDELQLYIAPPERGMRSCYVFATAGGTVADERAVLRAPVPLFQSPARLRVRAKFATSLWPERVRLSLSVADGTLAIYDDEQLYAFLVKDGAATLAAAEVRADL